MTNRNLSGGQFEFLDEEQGQDVFGNRQYSLVAQREGKRLGHANILVEEDNALVEWVHTEPQFRRQGVGTALTEELSRRHAGGLFTDYEGSSRQGKQLMKTLRGRGLDIKDVG